MPLLGGGEAAQLRARRQCGEKRPFAVSVQARLVTAGWAKKKGAQWAPVCTSG